MNLGRSQFDESQAPPADTATPQVGDHVPLALIERRHVEAVLASTCTLDEAARVLEIDHSTLYRKRRAYGLPINDHTKRKPAR